ncbi:MAG TPA: hypothetical protein VKQ08_09400, partial [Cyclobacteriaceae bacterium]|nr:hypothetical protein [Cyclobacteriaceae bacterium]
STMKNSAFIILLVLAGCTFPLFNGDQKTFPASKDTMIIRQVRYVGSSADTLNFEIDLYHVKGYNFEHSVLPANFYNDFGLDPSYFVLPTDGTFVLKGSGRFYGAASVPSAAAILADESGSYDTLDRYNNRSQGLTKLCKDFVSPGEFIVGGFSQNGNLTSEPIEFYQTGFSPYQGGEMPFIFDLCKKTGGQSNLYDAVNNALDKLIAGGRTPKNIIVLAHASDEVSSILIDNLIAKANASQVQIHILFRGQVADANPMAKLSEGTKGAFVICPSVGEMMCSFENLYSVLGAADQVYRLNVKYKPSSGTITSGQELWFAIKTHDQYFNIDNNPIVAYVKVP